MVVEKRLVFSKSVKASYWFKFEAIASKKNSSSIIGKLRSKNIQDDSTRVKG